MKKTKKKSIKKSKKDATIPSEKITFSPLYAVFDLSGESDESIMRPKVIKTEGGYVNEDMDRSTWL